MPGATTLIDEIKKVLGAYAKNAKPESMFTLKDMLRELDRTEALKEIGCNENCPVCTWGRPEARAWENHCRIWAFLELIEDQDAGRERGNAVVQKEARDLLEALETSDRPKAQ